MGDLPSQVFDYRNSKKIPQLKSIVRDNIEYYEALHGGFISKGRYFKITGNHDRDMGKAGYASVVSEILGHAFPLACDVMLLKSRGITEFIICHGHQFDTSCTPKFAAKAGESFSQASAWAFQGPDRIWRTKYDQMDAWLAGREPFLNALVTDEPDSGGFLEQEVCEDAQQAWDALGMEISNLNTERGWESIYGKNIAWNYFENEGDPQKCIDLEVSTGKRWFKFRHLNELRLTVELENAFGPRVPTLILGHTHEPRFRPRKASGQSGHSQNWQEIDFYANSGSAGRFENLIWGIEILDRAPLLISWHRDGDRMPVRTVWESFGTNGGFLRPASSGTPEEFLGPGEDSAVDFCSVMIAAGQIL